MSTRSAIGRIRHNQFSGVMVHYDGDPGTKLPDLHTLAHRYGLSTMLSTLTEVYSGWESIDPTTTSETRAFHAPHCVAVPGYGEAYNPQIGGKPVVADLLDDDLLDSDALGCWIEWVYAFNENDDLSVYALKWHPDDTSSGGRGFEHRMITRIPDLTRLTDRALWDFFNRCTSLDDTVDEPSSVNNDPQEHPAESPACYIAAPYAKWPEAENLATQLRVTGATVVSTWHKEAATSTVPQVRSVMLTENPDLGVEPARRCLEDLARADTLILFANHVPGAAGRLIEFGWALAHGLRLIVIGHRESIFQSLPEVQLFATAEEFIHRLTDKGDMTEDERITETRDRIATLGDAYNVDREQSLAAGALLSRLFRDTGAPFPCLSFDTGWAEFRAVWSRRQWSVEIGIPDSPDEDTFLRTTGFIFSPTSGLHRELPVGYVRLLLSIMYASEPDPPSRRNTP